jgi:microcystin-dependent protein
MNTKPVLRTLALLASLFVASLSAQVPQLINYQGRVAVGTASFNGSGQFKFALVDGSGSVTYWSNDGTSQDGGEPSAAVSLPVTKGLYSVLLGNVEIPNMQGVPASVFSNTDVRLRVWFDDGVNGSQLLSPDQRIAAVGYALVASTLQPGASFSADSATFSGRVGVGTTSPNDALTVQTGFGTGITHTNGDHSIGTYIDSNGAEFGTFTADPLGFFAGNNDYQIILFPNGDVSIGLTPGDAHTSKLTVNGNVAALSFSGNGANLTNVANLTNFGHDTNQAQEAIGRQGTIGEIILSAGSRANGIICNGQLLPISEYEALATLLGTTYGGDGITTFGVPDLRAVAPNGLSYTILAVGIFPSTP